MGKTVKLSWYFNHAFFDEFSLQLFNIIKKSCIALIISLMEIKSYTVSPKSNE